MKYVAFFLILSFQLSVHAQSDSLDKRGWIYVTDMKSFSGEVLHYEPAISNCNTVAYASICIVKMENGKQLRVLTLCNTKNNLKKGDEIVVSPQKKPEMEVNISPADGRFDALKPTIYGSITKFE